MALKDWPVFRAGLFRQAKYLVSTPQKAQNVMEILETGIVAIEPLPMQTGFMQAPSADVRKAWANVHALKFRIYKYGEPTGDEAVLIISERNYIPLDPLGIIREKEREKLASLKDIAKIRHAQQVAKVSTYDQHKDLAYTIVQGSFILIGLLIIIHIIWG